MQVVVLKYRVYPTAAQETFLLRTLDTCRRVYNRLLSWREAAYEVGQQTPSRYDQQKAFPHWTEDCPELRNVHSQVLQNVAVRVDLAFRAFFRRVKAGEKPGYPRYKGRGVYDSITYPQWGNGVQLVGECLHLSKVGQVRVKMHRPLVGTPKNCTLRRYGYKWYTCITVEVDDTPLSPSEEEVGMDVGLLSFCAFSDGSDPVPAPKFFRRDEKDLARAQRKLSKHKKGTPTRKKARKVVSRVHERVRFRRVDFVHQLARRIINRYGFIAVEKLNVQNMQGSHCLAKSIADAAWGSFRTVLASKAASAAREYAEVDPRYTRQDCSGCGYRAPKNLSDRWHLCPMCGLSLDRDVNAAVNILASARRGVWGNTLQAGIPA